MRPLAIFRAVAVLPIVFAARTARAATTCNTTFHEVSASAFAAALNPGYNIGNTMDAIPDETSWGQPLIVPSTIANIKAQGFRGIRLPVTWADHFITDSPSWDIDPAWLERVSDVVDMITAEDMPVIVNAHHDSWIWADPTAAGANLTMIQEKFYRLWYQVGTTLGCKPAIVGFEPLNEPSGSDASAAEFLNNLQSIMIQAISDAGGFNTYRFILLGGLGDNYVNAVEWFARPASNITNPWAMTYHYYSPWEFIATAWGDTIWGSDSDKASMEDDIVWARNNFSDVPVIIGEYAASPVTTETAARWKWYDFLVQTATKQNTSVMLWDAGGSFAINSSAPWPDPTTIEIIMAAAKGIPNALANSTEDPNADTQWSSASVLHQSGTAVIDQTLPFLLNGNTLLGITADSPKAGTALRPGADYAVSGSNITFKASYLSTLFPSGTMPGAKANLTLHFDRGAGLRLGAYEWTTPVLGSTNSTATNASAQSDLHIPCTYKGIPQLATVKAMMTNGSYLIDTWTMWLGPLQQGRVTEGSQFNWDTTEVIILAAALQVVVDEQAPNVFTFEFFPRQPGNAVNYTVYV